MNFEAVVIGASAGGLNAFTTVLAELPSDFDTPIIIVQHLLDDNESYLSEHLNNICQLEVIEACDKQQIENNKIYVSPPGYHILIESKSSISLSMDTPVNYSRPSIDLLFESAANVFKEKLAAILMTGANDDGARGMKRIHERGGYCVVQDPLSAESSLMPESAIALTEVDLILTPPEIGQWLAQQGGDDD